MPREFEVIEEDCIGCRLCSERAPENLEIPEGSTLARVFKQPTTPAEEEACLEASEYCPMGGLQRRAAAGEAGGSAESNARPAFAPAGDSRPAGATPTEMEN